MAAFVSRGFDIAERMLHRYDSRPASAAEIWHRLFPGAAWRNRPRRSLLSLARVRQAAIARFSFVSVLIMTGARSTNPASRRRNVQHIDEMAIPENSSGM